VIKVKYDEPFTRIPSISFISLYFFLSGLGLHTVKTKTMDWSGALAVAINIYQTFVVGPLREHPVLPMKIFQHTHYGYSAPLSESGQCALSKQFRPLFFAEWRAFWG
jgi:hypothetical protein